MIHTIETGHLAFIPGRVEAIGAVRSVSDEAVTIYVENSGEYDVPVTAVTGVHDGKVMINTAMLPPAFLAAVVHVHDSEDPTLVG
jgi:hypothetical protein